MNITYLTKKRGVLFSEIKNKNSISFKKRTIGLICFITLFTVQFVFAQTFKISGTVTDKGGIALPGVNIKLKSGYGNNTLTDVNGKYSLDAINKNDVIVFTYVGFTPQEIKIEGRERINVTMLDEVRMLNDIVVVGYGNQKRSDITGSIASVKVKDLEGTPLRSIDQALQGRVAGVNFTQNSGMPGAGSSIRIRGGNSITGSNEPLYVIDGVPVFANPGTSANNLNPLNTINISDIESIEVLKDASATAIYGSRGGNGVIIVTTKRGKKGQAKTDFQAYTGIQSATKKYDLLNAIQFEKLANEATVVEGGVPIYDLSLSPRTTDWQDLIIQDAPISNYQVSISGGEEKTSFLLTANYFKQNGVARSSDLERYSFRLNLDRDLGEKFKIGSSISVTNVRTNKINGGTLLSMLTLAPNIPVRQADGSYTTYNSEGQYFNNPIALVENEINFNNLYRTLGNGFASVEIVKGLTFKTLLGVDATFSKNDSYTPQAVFSGAQVGGSAGISTNQNYVWLNENTLTYQIKEGKHSVNALLGYTQQASQYESVSASAQGFLNDNLGTNALQTGADFLAPASGVGAWSLQSFIGRLNYGYESKYLLTLTGRYDGSSRFGKNNRFGFFPSAAVSWRLDQEEVIKNLDVFSNLKMRLSHGLTGNQDGIGNNPSLDLLGVEYYTFGGTRVIGLAPSQVGNADLKWESTTQTNLGLEFGFFNNKLSFVTDIYYKKTNDLLLSVRIPGTSGFTSALKNIGSVENKGFEFSVNSSPINKAFTWESSFNIAFNKNKILNLGDDTELFAGQGPNQSTVLRVGQPLGTFFGYLTNGTYRDVEQAVNSAEPTARPGDIRYVDFKEDGKINDDDRTILGSAQPDFISGFMNTFSYKSFGLNVFLQGTYGNEVYNANKITLENVQGYVNQSTSVLSRWTPENYLTVIPKASSTKPTARSLDRYVEDASYLRLKTLQLSWKFPEILTKKIGANSAMIYVNAQNLYTLTNYTGLDPEVSRYGSDNVSPGFDSGAYPNIRTFMLGVNIGF